MVKLFTVINIDRQLLRIKSFSFYYFNKRDSFLWYEGNLLLRSSFPVDQ